MPIRLDDETWLLIRQVNREVNRERYVRDDALYGKPEFWELMAGRGGDCEDYALTKRKRLIESGLDPACLQIARGRVAPGEGHAVLLVETDRGAYVLDNIVPEVLPWRDKDVSIKRWADRTSADGRWVNFDAG
jgi:predicted transglutaminase-like cysteine proteinase